MIYPISVDARSSKMGRGRGQNFLVSINPSYVSLLGYVKVDMEQQQGVLFCFVLFFKSVLSRVQVIKKDTMSEVCFLSACLELANWGERLALPWPVWGLDELHERV